MLHLCEEEVHAQLPVSIRPTHYDISLIVNISKQEFEGVVVIYINVLQRTKQVRLHFLDLEIVNIKLINANGVQIEPEKNVLSTKNQLLTLLFNKPVVYGSYCLKIEYEGSLTEDQRGMFFCRYCESPEQEKMVVFTNFERAYARKCFPCWDEPAFKATFRLSITVSSEYTALSNMPVEKIEKFGKNKKYQFFTTPMMSTFHLAFALGQFAYVEVLTPDGKLLRINSLTAREKQATHELNMAMNALAFYTKYFNIPYPLSKLDFIVCPKNYGFDKMANWGLINFREIDIFTDRKTTANGAEKYMTLVINHQIAHQWLGNLVTMQSWFQFWFIEAVTKFAEYLCYDSTLPHCEIWKHFVLEFLHTAFLLDESKKSYCFKKAIKTGQDVESLYYGISYNKGISLIRMLHWYVGDDSFRKALHVYLSTYSYKNASPDNFFSILEEITDKPVLCMMSTWLNQPGFPMVKISIAPGCDCKVKKHGVTVHLIQSRFTSNNTQKKLGLDKTLWKIPIWIVTADNKEIKILLEDSELKLFLPDSNPEDWIKLNPGAVGYYRVHYSSELITIIGRALVSEAFPEIDRLIILDDLFHMVKYEHSSITEMIELLSAFQHEKAFLVWSAISRTISKLMIVLTNSSMEDYFNKFQRKLLDDAVDPQDKSKKGIFDKFLKELMLGQKSWLTDDIIINQAKRLVADEKEINEGLPNDMKIAFYHTIVKSGVKKFNALMKLYKTVDTHEERKSVYYHLSNSKDAKWLRKILTFAMLNEADPTYTSLIVMVINFAKTGKDFLWDYYKSYWKDILNTNKEVIGKIAEDIKDRYANDALTVEIETFLKNICPSSKSALDNILEKLKHKSVWNETDDIQKCLSPY